MTAALVLGLASCGTRRTVSRGHDNRRPMVTTQEIPDDVSRALVREARSWIGVPYVWGGKTRDGVDCSGFLMTVFQRAACVSLPRTTVDQRNHCLPVDSALMDPGDLIFFSSKASGGKIAHVGMYVGGGKMIHASSSRGVVEDNLSLKYYKQHFRGAGRVPELAAKKKQAKAQSTKKAQGAKHQRPISAPPHATPAPDNILHPTLPPDVRRQTPRPVRTVSLDSLAEALEAILPNAPAQPADSVRTATQPARQVMDAFRKTRPQK